MNAKPLVSIGVPVYNGARFLPETLKRLCEQDLKSIEIIVCDNGSTDETEQICRAAAAKDERIGYHRSSFNRGLYWNFNRTLELATAPLFMWNPADDLPRHDYLSRAVTALEANPAAGLAFPEIEIVDADGAKLERLTTLDGSGTSAEPAARVRSFLATESWDLVFAVIRTELLRTAGGLPEMIGDDVVLGADLLLRAPMVHLNAPLFQRRRHEDQASQDHDPAAGAKQRRPGADPWLALPSWRINFELYRRVFAAPLTPGQRRQAASAVWSAWSVPKARRLLGDVRRSLRLLARRSRAGVLRQTTKRG